MIQIILILRSIRTFAIKNLSKPSYQGSCLRRTIEWLISIIPEEEVHTIGIWGRKHQQYLREHRPIIYSDLILRGKLYGYLADIDTQARNKLDLLVTQLAEKEGINESLKAQNQLAWIGAMNNIRNRAEEFINAELIFA